MKKTIKKINKNLISKSKAFKSLKKYFKKLANPKS